MKFFDPLVMTKTWKLVLLASSLCLAGEGRMDRLLWILSRFDSLPQTSSGGISHCQLMAQSQRELLALRDTIARIREVGRSRQATCRTEGSTSDSSCTASLQILRDSLKALSQRDSRSSEEVGQHSAKCPTATWLQWIRYQKLDSLLATSPPERPATERLALVQELAELGWKGNLDAILRSPAPSALRLDRHVIERFQDPTASRQWRLRHAFQLEWGQQTDSARTLLQSLFKDSSVSADDSALLHFWLGSDPSQSDSLRREHLQAAVHRPDLRARSLHGLAPLLAASSRWKEAFDTLSAALCVEESLVDSSSIALLALWADRAKIDPFENSTKKPPVWLDQPKWQDQLWIARGRLLLDSGRARAAQALLADFRLRFPQSSRGEEARELLARSRR